MSDHDKHIEIVLEYFRKAAEDPWTKTPVGITAAGFYAAVFNLAVERDRLRAELAAAIKQRDEACQRTYNAGFVEASRIHGIQIQQLRKQRDDARQGLCHMIALRRKDRGLDSDPETVAAERGWDCFAKKEGGGA